MMDAFANVAKTSVDQLSTQAEATGNALGHSAIDQAQNQAGAIGQQVAGGAQQESQRLLGGGMEHVNSAQHQYNSAHQQANDVRQQFGGTAGGIYSQVHTLGSQFSTPGNNHDVTDLLNGVFNTDGVTPLPGSVDSPEESVLTFLADKDKGAKSMDTLLATSQSFGISPAPGRHRGDSANSFAGVASHLDFAKHGAGAAAGFAATAAPGLGRSSPSPEGGFASTEPHLRNAGNAQGTQQFSKTYSGGMERKKTADNIAPTASAMGHKEETKSKEEEAAESERNKATEKLDNLKIKTMHDMVHSVDIPMGDSTTKCQFLYLTNKQAAEVKIDLMPLVRSKLQLKEPEMVIRLIPSRFGQQYWQGNPHYKGRFPAKQTPEENGKDEDKAEHQLLLLAKEVLLPFANRTKALILGQEGCSLTAAFLKVAASYQKQMKQDCPFSVLIFASAYNFNARVKENNTTIGHFYSNCDAWSQREKVMTKAIEDKYGDDDTYWPRFDLPQGRYSLIMFECLNVQTAGNPKISEQTPGNFQNDFISSLSKVPAIAVQTYGSANMNLLPTMAEHVSRGSSLLLIDSRNRKNASTAKSVFSNPADAAHDYLDRCKKELDEFSDMLHKDRSERKEDPRPGLADWYNTSALAFVKLALDKARDAIHKDTAGEEAVDGTGKKKQSEMWLWEAISTIRKKKQKFQARAATGNGTGTGDDGQGKEAAKASLEEQCLVKATNIIMSYVGKEREWEFRQRHKCFETARDALDASKSFPDLKTTLEKEWLALRGVALHKFEKARNLAENYSQYFELEVKKKAGNNGSMMIVVKEAKGTSQEEFDEAKKALVNMFDQEYSESSEWDMQCGTERAFCAMEDKWMAIYDILKSDNVETGSLHLLKECNKKLGETAKIDYLPEQNTFEALILIRRAWTLHDVFQVHAGWYKYISKISIMVMLLVGTATVTVVSLNGIVDEESLGEDWKTNEKHALLGLSLFGSLITGLTTLMEPTRKWLHLRGAQLRLASEIWKFRTRMGDYAGGSAAVSSFGRDFADRQAEANFKMMLAHVQEKVGGAGLKRTRFYSIATTAADTLNTSYDRPAGGHIDAADRPPAWTRCLCWFKGQMLTSGDPHLQHRKYIQHGQFEVDEYKLGPKNVDNFHSPQSPESYIRHRLVKLRDYYQGKIPTYANLYRLYQALLLLASVVSALIAAIWEGRAITAVIASLAGLIAAWQEFTAVEKKLDRYSGIANSLENILLWWQALPPEEKKNLNNVERLVNSTEALVAGEQAAWMSDTQQAVQKVQQQNQKNGEVAVNVDGNGNNNNGQGGGRGGGGGGGKA